MPHFFYSLIVPYLYSLLLLLCTSLYNFLFYFLDIYNYFSSILFIYEIEENQWLTFSTNRVVKYSIRRQTWNFFKNLFHNVVLTFAGKNNISIYDKYSLYFSIYCLLSKTIKFLASMPLYFSFSITSGSLMVHFRSFPAYFLD